MTTTIGSLDLNSANSLYNDATQYFWFESDSTATYGAGVHITLSPSATFMSNPTGQNILINTDGISIRNGLLPMMTLDNDSLGFNVVDTTNGTYTNVASFGAKILIGESNSARVEISPNSINAYDQNGATAFSVQSDGAATTKDIQVRKNIDAFIGLRSASATYTLPNTPIANSEIAVSFYAGGEEYSFSYLYGATGIHNESSVGITFSYAGNTITATATQYAIAWASVSYTMRTTNALVDIPAELHIQTENFTDFLFTPKFSVDGLSPYNSRVEYDYDGLDGGYIDIGKWRYVHLPMELNTTLSASNYYTIVSGFAVPAGLSGYAALSAFSPKNGGVYSAYINSDGRLRVVTGATRLVAEDVLVVSGWYLKA